MNSQLIFGFDISLHFTSGLNPRRVLIKELHIFHLAHYTLKVRNSLNWPLHIIIYIEKSLEDDFIEILPVKLNFSCDI